MQLDDWEINKLLLETSFPFLAASEGHWINGEGQKLSYRQMSLEYLERSLAYLKKFEEGLEDALVNDLKAAIKNLSKEKREKCLSEFEELLEYCRELYEDKKNELEELLD